MSACHPHIRIAKGVEKNIRGWIGIVGYLGKKKRGDPNHTAPYTIRVRNSHVFSQNYIADPSIKTKDPTTMTAGTLPPAMVPAAPVWVGLEVEDPESVTVAVAVAVSLVSEPEVVATVLTAAEEEEVVFASASTVVVAVARTTVLVTVSVAVEVTVSASAI